MTEKAADAYRTISEVADALDVPQHVLRFWESKFTAVKPLKRSGNRRYYRPEDIDVLRAIQRLLHKDGLTIKGAQKLFREKGARGVVAGALGGEPMIADAKPMPSPANDGTERVVVEKIVEKVVVQAAGLLNEAERDRLVADLSAISARLRNL